MKAVIILILVLLTLWNAQPSPAVNVSEPQQLVEEYFAPGSELTGESPLTGGSVNPIYLGQIGSELYVFRFGPDWQTAKSFDNEVVISTLAAQLGISPELYYSSSDIKGMILEYIPSTPLGSVAAEERNDPEILQKVSELIRLVHQMPYVLFFEEERELAPYRTFYNDERRFKREGIDFGEDYQKALSYVKEVENRWRQQQPTVIHQDLHGGNILIEKNEGGEKRAYLIDWTFAAYGDPYFDVAKASSSFTPQVALLNAYLQREPTERELAHYKDMYGLYLLERYFNWLEVASVETMQGKDSKEALAKAAKEYASWESFIMAQ